MPLQFTAMWRATPNRQRYSSHARCATIPKAWAESIFWTVCCQPIERESSAKSDGGTYLWTAWTWQWSHPVSCTPWLLHHARFSRTHSFVAKLSPVCWKIHLEVVKEVPLHLCHLAFDTMRLVTIMALPHKVAARTVGATRARYVRNVESDFIRTVLNHSIRRIKWAWLQLISLKC